MRLLLALFALLAVAAPGYAQNAYNLFVVGSGTTSYATLQDAIFAANGASSQATLSIDYNLTGGTVSLTSQLVIGLYQLNSGGLVIDGNNVTIDMNGQDRAFFIASGNVTLQNMTISNGFAQGGVGGNGGGGGAGLGGAIFIANPTAITTGGDGTFTSDNLVLPTAVTLSSVSFSNNTATGGGPSDLNSNGPYNSGGGGGMGGDGGSGIANDFSVIGGGGGGFGNGADGGTYSGGPSQGGSGAMVFTLSPLSAAPGGGAGGDESNGGQYAGGGGMGENDDIDDQSGGGGGANAESGHSSEGGNGGFGGGGGGATSNSGSGGNGGFGGGGGANVEMDSFGTVTPGNGGFGGGGGVGAGGNSDIVLGQGGFAAGDATDPFSTGSAHSGAGASLGGAVFVMSGASLTITSAGFSSNQAQAPAPIGVGLTGYGDDIFLGGNVTFSVAANETVSLSNLGGAGNLNDSTVSAHRDDLNAQGGIIVQGPGTVQLRGSANYYSGSTVVNQGTLALAAGAVEVGTSSVTIGQIDGLEATLALGSNSGLFLKGFDTADVQNSTDVAIQIAQGVGSRGKIVIGAGAGSSGADIGARVFTGAGGTATVEFQQQYAFNSNSDTVYHFYTTLTGALDIEQTGPGTTLLNPIYGENSFTGEVIITDGVLGTTGAAAALAGATSITLDGGDFEIGQSNGINDSATLNQGEGTVRITDNFIEQTFGAWNITAATVLDFNEFAADLTFASLTITGPLAIYNYDAEDNFITILSGTATGSLSQIAFYSDEGDTFIGTGTINGTSLDVVPEPSTWALLGLGVLILGLSARRRAAAR